MFKISRPVLYALLATLGVAGYLLTEPADTPQSKRKRPTRSATAKKDTQFTEEDYERTFPVLATAPKNAFKPLVVRSDSGSMATTPGSENAIPSGFADGDGNWVVTGTAEEDGVAMALLENKSTGEGQFVKVGERWRRALLVDVEDSSVVFVGPNGESKTIPIHTEDPKKFEPAKPTGPMQGPIGPGQFQLPPGMFRGGEGAAPEGATVITIG